mmetsp:Transcript_8058/g.20340  ORF Transcript_8058/g.20340 Transcript_8058/m.20340 type:complete len:363 (-) Transcript_8058:205-1293(-)|eukprot:CAMPEP_0177653680 /NCGR_PEP_ID=MMETSP0447-20121125/13879_1 /TAXON_ID=0 /ORGANISM="Stygamoeba regulata, Strain BSH-02190019" /LENGTH=362 /DNA_ID=CAMNT_0019157181 /DNA_START=141 /DNA_END=1229 /DNA_ORIENTATION=-
MSGAASQKGAPGSGKLSKRVAEKDRHSRSGVNDGPKKNGAGGKAAWGKLGDELNADSTPDSHDPAYSEFSDEEDFVLTEVDTTSDQVLPLVKDYLASGEATETLKSLFELNLPQSYSQFIKQGILYACEHGPFERELMSRIVLSIYDIEPGQVEEGFKLLMVRLPETKVDVPDAIDITAKFIARAVIDDALPPRFTEQEPTNADARECLHLARTQSLSKHAGTRVEHIWGAGDMVSVKRLKQEVDALVKEFVASGDISEAERAVRELASPHFHFYIVKTAIRDAFVFTQHERHVLDLLHHLLKIGLTSPEQFLKGVKVIEETLDDLKLDAPNAGQLFQSMCDKGKKEGWWPSDAANSVAQAA